MKIIQFRCESDPPATELKELIVEQMNLWSRLQFLSSDPEYATEKFSVEIWKNKHNDSHTFWVNWDDIYLNLGDDGKKIADRMLGEKPFQGIIRRASFAEEFPDIRLELVDVADLVSEGYIAAEK